MSQFKGTNFNLRAMPTAVNTGKRLSHPVIHSVLSTLLQIRPDERHSPPRPVQSQVPRHSGSSIIDNSGNSFSTYLAKENERIKKIENQRADAHEILIFVSGAALHLFTYILIQNNQGCPTRSHSCDAYWCIYPGPPTRPTRQMGFLSGEDLRITRRHQRAP